MDNKSHNSPSSKNQNENNLNKDLLKKILDNTYNEIFVYDDNFKVIYVNNACKRHYGLKPSEIIGKTLWDFKERQYWQPLTLPIVYQKKERITMEQETYLGDKIVHTAAPVLDDNGEIELVVMSIHESIENLNVIKRSAIKEQNDKVKINKDYDFKDCDIITRSKQMQDSIKLAKRAAKVDSTILIQGESGTGKGLLAKYIHKVSERKKNSMFTINCAAIPEDLIEAELFGYSPGAFTGADSSGKKGLIELADNGTLFLDEVGELSPKVQAKLLQVIQEQQFIPVGGKEVKNVDIRIIAATNRNLKQMVQNKEFREDLYYRLNVIEIELTPLKERPKDILPLIYYYLNKFNTKFGYSRQFSEECLNTLEQYNWPGNVRELRNVVERLIVTVDQQIIDTHHLPKKFQQTSKFKYKKTLPTSLDAAKDQIENDLITKAYEKHGSSRKVAKALEISQSRASRLIRKYVTN